MFIRFGYLTHETKSKENIRFLEWITHIQNMKLKIATSENGKDQNILLTKLWMQRDWEMQIEKRKI